MSTQVQEKKMAVINEIIVACMVDEQTVRVASE